MSQGARTIADLERLMLAHDLRRRKDRRELRRELVEIRDLLSLPATNSRPTAWRTGTNAGTALGRARSFFARVFGR